MTSVQFNHLTGILKFEYSHGRTSPKDLLNINNKYFTCSPRPARQLSSDKLLFLVILDDYKNDVPRIIGRAKTLGFKDSNIADAQMIKKYSGLSHYKYYVDMYDIEVIKGNINNGINLYDVIGIYGLNMFPSTKAKNPYRAYTQQSYRIISNNARDYINNELESRGIEKL